MNSEHEQQDPSRKRVLIVGNLGYIGSVLTAHLRKSRASSYLVGYDNGYFQGCLINPHECNDHLLNEQHYGDLRKIDIDFLRDFHSVISLAAISNDPMGHSYELATQQINTDANYRLACLSKECGVKNFIFASSCSVYGTGGDKVKSERSELNPLTTYAKSKILSENLLQSLAEEDFIITCLRFATACGSSPRLRLDLVLNDFVASSVLSNKIEISSDGTPWRPLIEVTDMARAIEWGIDRKRTNGGNFLTTNVGSEEWNFTIKELALAVQKVIPETTITFNKFPTPDKRSYRVSFSLFKDLAPDYQPLKTLHSTVIDVAKTIKNSGYSDALFRKSFLIRLNALNSLCENKKVDPELNWI